jgi:hypothetical protein
MTPGNREEMPVSDREPVPDQKRKRIFRENPPVLHVAERTSSLPHRVALPDAPEIGIIPSSLVGVALPARGLKVLGIVCSPE